ncbi:hypothetical protein KCV87_03330 [Actinosynnema pretiosum subsp. pretiosum]|uniref:Peptidase inhibitor family I36 n=1 Tax=Actinosynnema pretiosum subsp. pretiosum TaxID=103721 RepID=A0AA45R4Q4_9PSEU|nr:hypothetical protein KCV87_03330 [Actinosynnema pretiosum subsp. pretiosum]
MRLKAFALAASAVGLLLTAPAATADPGDPNEAWPPGNCPRGSFCAWPHWAHPEPAPVEAPSLVSAGAWTGSALTSTYYNHTSGSVDVDYTFTWPGGTPTAASVCANPGGNIFYLQVVVTALRPRAGAC